VEPAETALKYLSKDPTGQKLMSKIVACKPDPEPVEPFIHQTAKVMAVWEAKAQVWVGGVGPEAKFAEQSQGWFVLFSGSYEALYAGPTKPTITVGDEVEILICKKAP
jgi:hypothetical protein